VSAKERKKGLSSSVWGVFRMGGVVGWTILWIFLAFVAVVLTLRRSTALRIAHKVWAPGVLRLAGLKLKVDPLPDLPWDRPHVFVMNHQSMMDIPVALTALPLDLHVVAKHSLKYVPILGWYMWATGMIFVERKNRQRSIETMGRAAKQIHDGASILVYAEGTRSKDGLLQPFKRGAFALALEAQVPVVPVAVVGTYEALATGGASVHPGTVRVAVGLPIPTEGRDPRARGELAQEAENRVRALLQSLSA
jgi:1-acyl-sn-glycerol-3-phosphate acyltransferase